MSSMGVTAARSPSAPPTQAKPASTSRRTTPIAATAVTSAPAASTARLRLGAPASAFATSRMLDHRSSRTATAPASTPPATPTIAGAAETSAYRKAASPAGLAPASAPAHRPTRSAVRTVSPSTATPITAGAAPTIATSFGQESRICPATSATATAVSTGGASSVWSAPMALARRWTTIPATAAPAATSARRRLRFASIAPAPVGAITRCVARPMPAFRSSAPIQR